MDLGDAISEPHTILDGVSCRPTSHFIDEVAEHNARLIPGAPVTLSRREEDNTLAAVVLFSRSES